MAEFPELDGRLILAPMAGVNCAAFRLLCREHGAAMVSTPMLVANQLVADPEKIISRTCFLKEEKPISVQLLGSDRNLMAEAARIVEPHADVIDINLGCPEKDALALKAGAFFVKHPEQIEKAVSPVISATNRPVSAKIRTGWDENSVKTLEIVRTLEDMGVSAITIHGRTRKQKYAGKADWGEIRKANQEIKGRTGIPVIGNGDVFKPGTAKAIMEYTGCDHVMIGRAAMGNPFIFSRANALLERGATVPEPAPQERIDCFLKFLDYYETYEDMRSFTEARQQAMWFIKGVKGSARLRNMISRAESVGGIISLLKEQREP
ncbi:MAG: tRNA dihydrouridine synthase DusB [Candidatus Woesearchaeota archaeon]